MPIAQSMLPEFDHEMTTTRSLLARVPNDQAGWKPHAKSMSLGEIAIHLASLPGWAPVTLAETELDMNPVGGPRYTPPPFQSVAAMLDSFDVNVKAARAAIAKATDEQLMVPWSLKNGGRVMFTLPRVGVLRSFVLNHMIHHRGQLSVYLRLRDVPLPNIYGPTADTA